MNDYQRTMKLSLIKNAIVFCIVTVLLNISCHKKVTNRGEKYGGTLHVNATDIPNILFPGRVLKFSEQLIINQVYIGLIKYNASNLNIEASLAKRWRIERNESLYTFYLNNNALFHNDECFGNDFTRPITAYDVKYSIEKIALYHTKSKHKVSSQFKNIVGSEVLFNDSIQTDSINIPGIEVLNDTTIKFNLKEADPLFLHFLAGSNALVFAKEAFNTYGFKSTVGSGPFLFKYPEIKGQTVNLIANPNYFAKNKQQQQIPFIDTVKVSFITSSKKEISMFEQNQLDMIVGISGNYVIDFLDKHIEKFQSNPPYYIMKQSVNTENKTMYNFMRSNVQNVYFNTIGYFDFAEAYFKDPEIQEIKLN